MNAKTLTIALLLAALALPRPAPAQWFNDPYRGMVSVCNDTAYQDYAQTCALGGGNTLFAWDDMRTGIDQVYFQVLNSAGLPLLETNGLPVFDGNWVYGWGSTTMKNLFPDGEGGALIVVTDDREGLPDLYGQRVDSQGNRLWGSTGQPLVVWPDSQQVLLSDIIIDSLENLFIAWTQYLGPEVPAGTYVQKVNTSGQQLWGQYGAVVADQVAANYFQQHLVPDGQGGVMQAWADDRLGPGNHRAFFQHLDSDGNALLQRNGVPVLTGGGGQFQMGLAACGSDGQGGAIWFTTAGGSQSALRLIRTNGAGHTLWDISSPYSCWHWIGDVQRHPLSNTIWITSSEDRTVPQVFRSYLYSVDIHGRFLFGRGGIPNVGGLLTPTSDGMIAVETDWDAPNYHVMAKRIHTSGRILWQSLVATYYFHIESCASDGTDGVVVAMNDGRFGPPDWSNIAAQRVLANGMLGSPQISIAQPIAGGQIQSTGNNSINYLLPQAGEIKLDLFNILGRKIATLQEGFKQPGSYIVPIDEQHLPSGVYLVRLNTPIGSEAARLIITK